MDNQNLIFSFSEMMLQPQILYKKMDFRTSNADESLSPSGGQMQTHLTPTSFESI